MKTLAYPCGGMPEEPKGRYSRLCSNQAGEWPEHGPAQLALLADEMKDSPTKRAARIEQTKSVTTVPSGYVYFGQFIDHDITKDNRYLADANPNVEETPNFRTAKLNLESVYGTKPDEVPCIYENDGQHLKLGWTLEASGMDGKPVAPSLNDLPRTANGTAITIDPRNDENLIVEQLQVLFIKFHNIVLELLPKRRELSPFPKKDLFEDARRFVTWHYQWLMLNDFLPSIARGKVLQAIKNPNSKPRLFARWYNPQDDPVALPVEFSVAAFRFGHSMVRNRYTVNRFLGGVPASEIIRMTKSGSGIKDRLPANYVVDWDGFFSKRSAGVNHAEVIDNVITEMLYDLPNQTKDAFRLQRSLKTPVPCSNEKMVPPLPLITLMRGSKIRLPGGEEFARRFNFTPIDPKEIFPARPSSSSAGYKAVHLCGIIYLARL